MAFAEFRQQTAAEIGQLQGRSDAQQHHGRHDDSRPARKKSEHVLIKRLEPALQSRLGRVADAGRRRAVAGVEATVAVATAATAAAAAAAAVAVAVAVAAAVAVVSSLTSATA